MHKVFNYPIKCGGASLSFKTVKIKTDKNNSEKYIFTDGIVGAYDPFSEPDIIPELVAMVEKVNNGGKKENLVPKWVSVWGLLDEHLYLDSFWSEAEKLYDIWNLYRSITNRDLKYLKKVTQVFEIKDSHINDYEKNRIEKEEQTHVFTFFNDKYDPIDIFGFMKKTEAELKDYQNAAIYYILEIMKPYINQGELGDYNVDRQELLNEDLYKVTPYLHFHRLIDALYMQIFILLSENTKKICPICNTPFVPSRQDKKYCSETCYNTAKNRRYRSTLKKII